MNSVLFILVNAQLLDSNRPKVLPKNSPLSQVLNVAEEKLSDSESMARSKCHLEPDEKAKLLSGILALDVDQNWKQQKKE